MNIIIELIIVSTIYMAVGYFIYWLIEKEMLI